MNFLTLDEFKNIQNIKSPNQDAEFSITIDAVNTLITNYLGYSNGESVNKIVYIASQKEILEDNWTNIDSIIIENGAPLTFKLSKGYILQIEENYEGNVVISGTLDTNVPNNALKQAAFSLAIYYIKDQFMQSISSNGGSISLPSYSSIPLHIKSILDLYRIK